MLIPCPELSKAIFYTTQKDSIKILYFQSASGQIIFMYDIVFFDKSVSLIVVTYTHTSAWRVLLVEHSKEGKAIV